MQQLANDPKNRVFQYENDEAKVKFTASQYQRLFNQTLTLAKQCRARDLTMTDTGVRERITREADEEMKSFIDNNGRIFFQLTSKQTTPEQLRHLYFMVYLREQVESGQITEDEAKIQVEEHTAKLCNTGLTPEEYNKKIKAQEEEKKKQKAEWVKKQREAHERGECSCCKQHSETVDKQ